MFGNFFNFGVKKIKEKNRPCINKSNLKLNNHQIRVIERLFINDGLLLVHSTGTGKTLSSIGIAECMIDNGIVENVIVSAPRVLVENFHKELKAYGVTENYNKYFVNTYMKNLPFVVRDLSPKVNKLMYIITDGYNNIGVHTVEDVYSVITEARKEGVICILLAANRDANELAYECGMDEKIAMTMGNDPHTTDLAMSFTNTMIREITSGSSTQETLEFTQLQRNSSQPIDDYDLNTTILSHTINKNTKESKYDSDDDNTLPPPPFNMPQLLTRQ